MFGTVTGMGISYFEYDGRHKKFTRTIGCEYLRFVKDHSFLRIQDMVALMNVSEQSFHLPEYAEDYEKLWEIYTGSYLIRRASGSLPRRSQGQTITTVIVILLLSGIILISGFALLLFSASRLMNTESFLQIGMS